MTVFDYSKAKPDIQRQIREALGPKAVPTEEAKPSKYRNVKTVYKSVQGFERKYDSIKEAKYAAKLDADIPFHVVKWWLPQVPIILPGGVRLVIDFLVCDWCDKISWRDTKGRETQASINKRKQAKALYGIDVEIV